MGKSGINNIVLIGSGNLAWHWCDWLLQCGLSPKITARDAEKAEALAEEFSLTSIPYREALPKETELVIVAVRDDAIREVSDLFEAEKAIWIHSSGSGSLDFLENKKLKAVAWPIISLVKGKKVKPEEAPLVLQSNDDKTFLQLEELFAPLFGTVVRAKTEADRQSWHLQATMLNNFIYFLLRQIKNIPEQSTDFNTLFGYLLQQTIEKGSSSEDEQTGAARRGDRVTLDKQKELMAKMPESLQKLYQTFTESILKEYGH